MWWNGRHDRLKSGCPVGRASSSLATGTRGSETVEYGACGRVLWPTLGRVALWLVPLRGVFSCGGWCAGSCCASCVRFVFDVLFPLFWTVIPRGRWVRLLSGSLTLCGWGSIPLLSAGVHVPACWGFPAFALAGGAWASLFSLSRPCSGGSPRRLGGRAPVGVCSWCFPFACGWAVVSALRAAREYAPLVGCGCCVWWRWLRMRCRDAPVAVPGWCGCGGFLVFAWRCSLGLRACACLCAPYFAHGVWCCGSRCRAPSLTIIVSRCDSPLG